MPLLFQKELNNQTRLGVWKIAETESFFTRSIRIQKKIEHPGKRLQHLAGRYLLKQLFADFPVDDIRLSSSNRPFLQNENYFFSISHCREFAAAIVSKNYRVGIDIEYPTEKLFNLKEKFLNAGELASLTKDCSLKKLTVLWSIKEAMFKWWGSGGVDFKKNLQINDFSLEISGSGDATFIKGNYEKKLTFFYQFLESLSLVWICSDTELYNETTIR